MSAVAGRECRFRFRQGMAHPWFSLQRMTTGRSRCFFDQLLIEAGQRPVLDRLGCCHGTQEVAEIVSESVKLKPDRIGRERPA